LLRATVVVAFNVLEAYLNGIAFDHLELDGAELTVAEKATLSEWDFQKQRPRYISLREKLLTYPRLIIGAEHPPLQEGNCSELKFIVEMAKKLRDSIVHASPAPSAVTLEAEKEKAVHSIDFETTERLVDATVTLIRKIEETINGDGQRLKGWLYSRSADGEFPDVVFE
jgi:hypothetical protein